MARALMCFLAIGGSSLPMANLRTGTIVRTLSAIAVWSRLSSRKWRPKVFLKNGSGYGVHQDTPLDGPIPRFPPREAAFLFDAPSLDVRGQQL